MSPPQAVKSTKVLFSFLRYIFVITFEGIMAKSELLGVGERRRNKIIRDGYQPALLEFQGTVISSGRHENMVPIQQFACNLFIAVMLSFD